uniref:Uncharacterized protein n=1 Tax=Romanomermis culicivorax TaxID=13658 RepID=A0A915KD04_ROMCU
MKFSFESLKLTGKTYSKWTFVGSSHANVHMYLLKLAGFYGLEPSSPAQQYFFMAQRPAHVELWKYTYSQIGARCIGDPDPKLHEHFVRPGPDTLKILDRPEEMTSTSPKTVHKPVSNCNTMCWTLVGTEIEEKILRHLMRGCPKSREMAPSGCFGFIFGTLKWHKKSKISMDDVNHLSLQIINLARAVNDIREKLGDIPIIKAAVLQSLRLHAVKQTAAASAVVLKPQATDRSTQTFDISVVRKTESSTISYSLLKSSINGLGPIVTARSTKDASTSPMTPFHSKSSTVGTQTGRKARIRLETCEERILLFNIHTLFGKLAAEKFFFEMDKKYLASQITKYRVDHNITILNQMQMRTKLLSIVNFDRKIIEYAREQSVNEQADLSDVGSESNCQIIDQTAEDVYTFEETACPSNVDENSKDQLKGAQHRERRDRIKIYDDKWYILKLPKVVECMKNQNFVDEILNLYFDEESYDSKPYRMLRERLRKTGTQLELTKKYKQNGQHREQDEALDFSWVVVELYEVVKKKPFSNGEST